MKKILILLSFLIITFPFLSCEKEGENVTIKETIEQNTITAITGSPIVLTMDNAANVFQTFKWTAVDYGFAASVTYTVQVDKKGNNFASPVNILSVTGSLTASTTVGDLNKILLAMDLEPDVSADMQFRVRSVINANVATVYTSNVAEAKITPYATSFPPIYMCGAALGGWDFAKSVEVRSSAPKIYQTIAYFINGETFRFFKQLDWGPTSYNYPYFTTVSTLFENANDGDKNFKVLGASGYYQVIVNLKTLTVDLVAVPEPKMFMTGAAVGGWDWTTNYVEMTWLPKVNKYEATTEFINGEAFRFFAQKDWGPTSYNYPYFSAGSVDALFENANDGDKNFRFKGTTGNYKVTLNLQDKIIIMAKQ